jgi:tetratricopeptide (TPR) repeat protein
VRFLKAISAGELFELLRPAAFIISALLSAWVLAGTRRRGWKPASVILWTAGAFFLPLVVFPFYLAAALFGLRGRTVDQENNESSNDTAENELAPSAEPQRLLRRVPMRRTLPILYFLVLIGIGGLSYYREWHSVDAHMARANRARLTNDYATVVAEYNAALKKENSPHIHSLLGTALMDTGAWDEALAEFETALKGGEPDDLLFYNTGLCLQNLGRKDEARDYFDRFLQTPRCRNTDLSERCRTAAQALAHQ